MAAVTFVLPLADPTFVHFWIWSAPHRAAFTDVVLVIVAGRTHPRLGRSRNSGGSSVRGLGVAAFLCGVVELDVVSESYERTSSLCTDSRQ